MKLIAHRGLTYGPNKDLENTPEQIKYCLSDRIDVEIDVWFENNHWYLGHDAPTYKTTLEFLNQEGLWIHCKNYQAAFQLLDLTKRGWNFNFFSHDKDDRTLTSHGYWWTDPHKELGPLSIAVMPEWTTDNLAQVKNWQCFGVCSDWISLIK